MIKNYKLLGYDFIFQIHDEDELFSNIIRDYGAFIDLETVFAYRFLLEPGDVFIDIGANIGWNTVFASMAVPNGHVYCFEPDPKNYNLLQKNIKLNVLSNVTLINKALADKIGYENLYLSNNNFGNHILNPSYYNSESHKEHISVETDTLDNFLLDKDLPVKFLKLDVEGSEPRVLNGAKYTINKYRPFISIEYHPFQIKQCGGSVFDIFSFIDKNNYIPVKIQPIDENNPRFVIEKYSIMSLMDLTKELQEKCAYKDILLIPSEKT